MKVDTPIISKDPGYSKNIITLQKGDIVFSEIRKGFDHIDSIIFAIQWISKKILGKSFDYDSTRLVHAYIVADVDKEHTYLIEAVPKKGVRKIEFFSDNSTNLMHNTNYHYRVLRPTAEFEEVAKRAADLANSVAFTDRSARKSSDRPNPKTVNPFSFWLAFRAMFTDASEFSFDAKKRVYKQIADGQQEDLQSFTGGSKKRKFFCSYFVAHVLQMSQAKEKVNEEVIGDSRKWAAQMAASDIDLKEKLGPFAYNAKAMAPYELYEHLLRHNAYSFPLEIEPPPT